MVDLEFPVLYHGRLECPVPVVRDVRFEVRKVFRKAGFWKQIEKSARIAVTAGSRGISDIVPVLVTVLKMLRDAGYYPFLLSAMGSHGGGTREGQLQVLAGLGITEETMGVPISAGGDAEVIGEITPGLPVYCNAAAMDCDGIIVVNRVKPHTSFHGPIESGLLKMLAVGLGNAKGAVALHSFGPGRMKELVPRAGSVLLDRLPVIYGIAIIENACGQTALIAGLEPGDFLEQEKILLKKAYSLMPSLPFQDIDLLVVREMGKCLSGTGMDTNVIGRSRIQGEPEPDRPKIKRIAVLDLAAASEGNAIGIGLADFTTDRLLSKVDWEATYNNVLSTTFVQRAMIPMHFPRDEETIGYALKSLGNGNPREARVAIIKNTLDLSEIYFSPAFLPEAGEHPFLKVNGTAREMAFVDGRLDL